MDGEDMVTVPDDKGMQLYLSYVMEIYNKQFPKKSALSAVKHAPDRRASAPYIVQSGGSSKGFGGVGASGDHIPAWKKKTTTSREEGNSVPVRQTLSMVPTSSKPPQIVVDADPKAELEHKLKKKDEEIEAMKVAIQMLEEKLDKESAEKKSLEDKVEREVKVASVMSVSGDAKKAMDELRGQVEDLEQQNQMLQMSLEDSRRTQLKLEQRGPETTKTTLNVGAVAKSNGSEELLRHELREYERRALAAEAELKELKSTTVTPSTPSSSGREDRLRKQVAELEDKVVTLEKEARALKRNADKATRLEKEMAEAEERESAHLKEIRELKREAAKVKELQAEIEQLKARK